MAIRDGEPRTATSTFTQLLTMNAGHMDRNTQNGVHVS